jgi:hypothetical protein
MGRSQPVNGVAPGALRRAALKKKTRQDGGPSFREESAPTAERTWNLGDSAVPAKIVELPEFRHARGHRHAF